MLSPPATTYRRSSPVWRCLTKRRLRPAPRSGPREDRRHGRGHRRRQHVEHALLPACVIVAAVRTRSALQVPTTAREQLNAERPPAINFERSRVEP